MSLSEQPRQGAGKSTPGDTNQQPSHSFADSAGATMEEAKQQSTEHYENLRKRATDQIESLAEGAHSAATALGGKDSLGISQHLEQLATGMNSFADRVRNKSAEDLLHEGALLARNNPALFLAGSVAIGFGLSRFLRASANHDDATASTSSTETDGDSSRTPDQQPYNETPTSFSAPTSPRGSTSGGVNDGPIPGTNLRGDEP